MSDELELLFEGRVAADAASPMSFSFGHSGSIPILYTVPLGQRSIS